MIKSRIQMRRGTQEEWDGQRGFVPLEGEFIVYLPDAQHSEPRIKIGDGSAYLIDLPFVGQDVNEELMKHINNPDIHISNEERTDWNEKVKVSVDENEEQVIFGFD